MVLDRESTMARPMAAPQSEFSKKGFLWILPEKKGLLMTEKGLVSAMEIEFMAVSESEKAFVEKPTKSFGEAKMEEM